MSFQENLIDNSQVEVRVSVLSDLSLFLRLEHPHSHLLSAAVVKMLTWVKTLSIQANWREGCGMREMSSIFSNQKVC